MFAHTLEESLFLGTVFLATTILGTALGFAAVKYGIYFGREKSKN